MVNDMNIKLLLPLLAAAALSACASTSQVASNDPVRARVQAELAQAQADGTHPLSEAQYVYPNWVTPHKAP
jgi:outer membrane biogenesis lipoprotein LolB